MAHELDLDAYLARVGVENAASPGLDTLRALHLAHPMAIPFENLTTLLHEPVPLDLESLQAKLVARRRGGYCFEQNRLFAEVLEKVGFSVVTLAARVVWNQTDPYANPRTHMVLLVQLGERYLCDVGFGGLTLTAPLLFTPGLEQATPHETFRLTERANEYELQVELSGQWKPMYRFDLQEQQPIDYDAFNHFVATHPTSHFRTRLVAGIATRTGRHALSDNALSIYTRGAAAERRTLESADEIRRALTDLFGIDPPAAPGLDAILGRIAATSPA